jgi:hypothetical protein
MMNLPVFDPNDPNSFPDILVHLFVGESASEMEPICFARIKALSILEEEFGGKINDGMIATTVDFVVGDIVTLKDVKISKDTVKNCMVEIPRLSKCQIIEINSSYIRVKLGSVEISVEPSELTKYSPRADFKWLSLREDQALDVLERNVFPGLLLLRLGLGSRKTWDDNKAAWERMSSPNHAGPEEKFPYVVRINIFQCRDLPAADDSGSIDPYLKLNLLGEERESKKKSETKDPMFYETFDFKCNINPAFGLQLAPRVCIQLWDRDFGIGELNDDYCGCCMLDLKHAFIDATNTAAQDFIPADLPSSCHVIKGDSALSSSNLPDPQWVSFILNKEGDSVGTLLASVQLIPSTPDFNEVPLPINILPESQEAWLEITSLGCRNLVPFNFLPIALPRVEFTLDILSGSLTQSTPNSKRPTPTDPNFLRYDVIQVKDFPKKSIFAPRLLLKAFDTRLGGLAMPNIGNVTIPLETKLPWEPATFYERPTNFFTPLTTAAAIPTTSSSGKDECFIENSKIEIGGVEETKADETTMSPNSEAVSSASNEVIFRRLFQSVLIQHFLMSPYPFFMCHFLPTYLRF